MNCDKTCTRHITCQGNVEQAISFYAQFVELWKNADGELQPQVKKARDRMTELQRRRG